MIAILLVTWLVIQIVDAIRSKDTFKMIAGVVGLSLAVLVCLGVVALPDCVRRLP
jgi:hypothetical protein